MKDYVEFKCDIHKDAYCFDKIINYNDKFNEYGIIIHDGGTSQINIQYCPWCGSCLPTSERNRWFDELEKLGYDNPGNQDIPSLYRSNQRYLKKQV